MRKMPPLFLLLAENVYYLSLDKNVATYGNVELLIIQLGIEGKPKNKECN